LNVVGTRRVETIAAGQIGNDRPIEVVDERWESPALKLLVLSQHHDPRTGDIEFRQTNMSRTEPLTTCSRYPPIIRLSTHLTVGGDPYAEKPSASVRAGPD